MKNTRANIVYFYLLLHAFYQVQIVIAVATVAVGATRVTCVRHVRFFIAIYRLLVNELVDNCVIMSE